MTLYKNLTPDPAMKARTGIRTYIYRVFFMQDLTGDGLPVMQADAAEASG